MKLRNRDIPSTYPTLATNRFTSSTKYPYRPIFQLTLLFSKPITISVISVTYLSYHTESVYDVIYVCTWGSDESLEKMSEEVLNIRVKKIKPQMLNFLLLSERRKR